LTPKELLLGLMFLCLFSIPGFFFQVGLPGFITLPDLLEPIDPWEVWEPRIAPSEPWERLTGNRRNVLESIDRGQNPCNGDVCQSAFSWKWQTRNCVFSFVCEKIWYYRRVFLDFNEFIIYIESQKIYMCNVFIHLFQYRQFTIKQFLCFQQYIKLRE
jgi:hypothetical protein